MLHEFALDPKVICDRSSARYFFDAFKPEKGRLISQFPKRWKKLVYEHCRSVVPHGSSLKYIEERLSRMDGSLIKTGRSFDPDLDWVVNAVHSHEKEPFKAIISPSPGPKVLSPDVDEEIQVWKECSCLTVRRRTQDMKECCSGLLHYAQEVVFVDPYFDGAKSQMKVFEGLIQEATAGLCLSQVEYHVRMQKLDSSEFEQRLRDTVLERVASLSVPIYFIRWQDGEESLHDRYILTDRAGVSVPQGLSECRAEECDTTEVSLLSQQTFELRRKQYSADNDGSFKFGDGWCISGDNIAPVAIESGAWHHL